MVTQEREGVPRPETPWNWEEDNGSGTEAIWVFGKMPDPMIWVVVGSADSLPREYYAGMMADDGRWFHLGHFKRGGDAAAFAEKLMRDEQEKWIEDAHKDGRAYYEEHVKEQA